MPKGIDALKNAGMTEAEAAVYIALLELGSTTAGPLIRKTCMHRATVYDTLRKLMEKGFVSHVVKGKKKYFESADPKIILEFLRDREEELKDVIPYFETKRMLAKERQDVTVYQGVKGIWTVMETILNDLRNGGEYYNFGVSGLFRTVMGRYWDLWQKRKAKWRIKALCIFDAGVKKRDPYLLQHYVGEKKFHPPEYRSLTDTLVYKDTVVMFIWAAQPPIAVVIKNKENADGYKKQFMFMWKHASKN